MAFLSRSPALSSSASCSSLSSSSSSTRSSCSLPEPGELGVARPNEHLAVLLPKHLWKPDASAPNCDNFYCRTPFSLLDRRHHCRKCGGVFCAPCSARSTALLDASNLPFLHPPRNTPLVVFESPVSPIAAARVCDDCYDQIHGLRSPDIPPRPAPLSRANSLLSSPIALFRAPSSGPSSAPSSPPPPATPPLHHSPSSPPAASPAPAPAPRPRAPSAPRPSRSAPTASSTRTRCAARASCARPPAAAAGSPSPRPLTPPCACPSSAARPRTSSRWSARRRRNGEGGVILLFAMVTSNTASPQCATPSPS
ncbi:FYVE zinc finger-domain-containing protein [Mycena haematopus]|nr:FYVE zinc finger-domain-containing protein [Mycena haematopus]